MCRDRWLAQQLNRSPEKLGEKVIGEYLPFLIMAERTAVRQLLCEVEEELP
jgi:hypothetical protein